MYINYVNIIALEQTTLLRETHVKRLLVVNIIHIVPLRLPVYFRFSEKWLPEDQIYSINSYFLKCKYWNNISDNRISKLCLLNISVCILCNDLVMWGDTCNSNQASVHWSVPIYLYFVCYDLEFLLMYNTMAAV